MLCYCLSRRLVVCYGHIKLLAGADFKLSDFYKISFNSMGVRTDLQRDPGDDALVLDATRALGQVLQTTGTNMSKE